MQNMFMLTHRDFVRRNPCKDESLFLRCNFFVWDILLKDAFSLKTEPILELCAWHLVALEFYNQKKLSVKRPCLKLYSLSEFINVFISIFLKLCWGLTWEISWYMAGPGYTNQSIQRKYHYEQNPTMPNTTHFHCTQHWQFSLVL